MMDYYGSITKQAEEVKQDLLSAFVPEDKGGYDKAYIEGLIEDLGILDEDYSVSGWAVFHYKTCSDLIRAQIQRDVHAAELAEKRLTLAKISE